ESQSQGNREEKLAPCEYSSRCSRDVLTLAPYLCTESSGMEDNLQNLTIGTFARTAGVNVETIRFYQRKGLLSEPRRLYGSIRRYGRSEVDRVGSVKSAQRLAFSLDEVAQLLHLEDGTHCGEAAEIASARLMDIRSRLADLSRMESVLSELVGRCHKRRGKIS